MNLIGQDSRVSLYCWPHINIPVLLGAVPSKSAHSKGTHPYASTSGLLFQGLPATRHRKKEDIDQGLRPETEHIQAQHPVKRNVPSQIQSSQSSLGTQTAVPPHLLASLKIYPKTRGSPQERTWTHVVPARRWRRPSARGRARRRSWGPCRRRRRSSMRLGTRRFGPEAVCFCEENTHGWPTATLAQDASEKGAR